MRTREKTGRTVSFGGVTLMMMFALMSLTIFGVISLLSARSDWKLAEKTAQAVTDVYAADRLAAQVMDELTQRGGVLPPDGLVCGVIVTKQGQQYSYQAPISQRQALQVALRQDEDGMHILQWAAVSLGDWTPQEDTQVWDGTTGS